MSRVRAVRGSQPKERNPPTMNFRNPLFRAKNRIAVEADLAEWTWQTRSLKRKGRGLTRGNKTALFCDLMSTVPTAKAEAIFAATLRQKNYRTVVLLRRSAPIFERIFRAAGPTRFVYLDEFITESIRHQARARAEEVVEGISDTESFLTFEENGFRIGRNVLSLVLREFRSGQMNLSSLDQQTRIREVLAESLATISVADSLLDDISPNLAIFNERGYTPGGELFDACHLRDIDTVQWVGAPKSDSLLFKRYSLSNRAVHPLSLSDETWAFLNTIPWTEKLDRQLMGRLRSHYETGAWFNRQKLQEGKAIKTKGDVYAQLELDPTKKTAVIFCHILYDATFFYGESLFPDYKAWLIETVRGAIGNPALNWVIKAHPVNVWRSKTDGAAIEQLEATALQEAFGDLPDHIRFMPADTDINTFSLFDAIDYGLTVRGTIGTELPCFGIPIVTAGTGRYSGRGFTIDPATPEKFRQTLATLHDMPRLSERTAKAARRYAYGTFFLRPQPIQSFELDFHALRFGSKDLAVNVYLRNSLNVQNGEAADLNAIAEWMTGGDEDFLNAEAGLLRMSSEQSKNLS